MQGWRRNMDVCQPLTVTGPTLPEGHTSYLSLCFLFIYLSAYFYPCDQDSDGELRNRGRNVLRMGLPASTQPGLIYMMASS